jgi:hypothetical protein
VSNAVARRAPVEVRISNGYDIRAIAEGAVRPGVWAGNGAAALGLSGHVNPADFEALLELITDEDEDQDDANPYEAKTAENGSLLEQMRRDGLL